jgi:hypothetical protein
MDIFKTFATDTTKETDGIWVDIGDAQFLVARAGNQKYAKKLSKLFERNQKLLERKDAAADKLSEKLMVEVLAETILLDWKNVQYEDKDLAYSRESAEMLLNIKDFRKQIMQLSDDFNAYKMVQEDDQEKN